MKRLIAHPIIIIIILSIALRIVSAIILGDQVVADPGIYDQLSYHKLAIRVISGHGFTFGEPWWPLTRAGEPTAHWSYLYTIYLAVVYKVFGIHPLVARIIQAILAGFLMPWLIYRIAKRVFSFSPDHATIIAATAAVWVTVYGYFIYYAGALMTETFYMTGLLWIFDATMRIGEKIKNNTGAAIRFTSFLELGLAISLTALLRQVFLPFIPILFCWLFLVFISKEKFWRALGLTFRGVLLTLLVFIVIIGPITVHNYQKFGTLVLIGTNAGYAFFWANHPIHGNYFIPLFTPDMPTYQDLIPAELRGLNEAEIEKALMALAVKEILNDPVRYLRLIISRIPSHFIFWPLPGSGLLSNVVRVASFGLALPFMLVGMGSWVIKEYQSNHKKIIEVIRSNGSLLLLFVVANTFVHLLSWTGIRYRLPQDMPSLIFAAYPLFFLLKKLKTAVPSVLLSSNREKIQA